MVALALSAPATVAAQASLTLDQLRPAVTAEDGFQVNRPDDRGHLEVGAMLTLAYALDPLVYEAMRGSAESERYALVEHQLAAHAAVSLGLFDRVVLYAALPVNLVMDGASPTGSFRAADGAGLGDAWLGGRVRLLGERDDVFALALQATLSLPTAMWANASQTYSGDQGTTVHPELLAEIRSGGWRLALNAGTRLRAVDRSRIQTLDVSHELTLGAGLTIPIWSEPQGAALTGHVELFGATTLERAFERETSPFEALAGLRAEPTCGLHVGLAGGTGISRGYGAPDFRGVLQVGWSASHCEQPVAAEPEPVIADTDGDGLLDDADTCPAEPEDADGFQDEDGCPDPDNDGDGVLDANDGAPMDPEDADGFEDADGVPDPDDDRDGIPDASDGCPREAEDVDGFQDGDGCPEADNDRDTIVDPDDECPLAPGRPEERGCPRTPPVRVHPRDERRRRALGAHRDVPERPHRRGDPAHERRRRRVAGV